MAPSPEAFQQTRSHQSDIGLIATAVAGHVAPVLRGADVADIGGWWDTQTDGFESVVADAFASTSLLAVRYLRRHAAIEDVDLAPVRAEPDRDLIREALRVTGPVAFKIHMRRSGSVEGALRTMVTTTVGTAQRLSLAGARRSTLETIDQSDAVVGYRRVTAADPCRFCRMLADRGIVFKSDRDALAVRGRDGRARGARRVGQSYHASDRCVAEPVYA